MREHQFWLCAVIAFTCYGLAMGTEGSKPRKKEEAKPEQNQPGKTEREKKPAEKQPEKNREKKPEKKPQPKPEHKPEKALEKASESEAAIQSKLAELDWLVGEWHDEGTEGIKVRNVFRWNSKRTFLIRSYQMEERDELTRQGTQMIGWDPVNQQIRSWIFGNEGGFAEGFWIVQHHGFQATLSGTMPDGGRAVVTQILKRTGENTMTSHLVGVEIDGQRQPENPAVKMRRVVDKDGR